MKPWMLAAMSGSPVLVTKTFTGNETWPAPAGVTILTSVTGKGQDGAPSSVTEAGGNVVVVNYRTDTSTGTGNATWDNLQSLAPAVADSLNQDGSASYQLYTVNVWPDGTNTVATSARFISQAIKGSATVVTGGGWQSSGPITESGFAGVEYNFGSGPTTGLSASAFGQNFPGGVGAAATTATFDNVAVTPGQSYSIVVPSGGYVTITYYK